MTPWIESKLGNYIISTDPSRLDRDTIADLLSRSYWAKGRPRERLERALDNSLVFGLYEGSRQIGLARVVSDFAIFAYLCDVIIHEDFRGRGLGKWLIQTVMQHPDLQGLRRWILSTLDAHDLYKRYGWQALNEPDNMLEILKPYPGEELA